MRQRLAFAMSPAKTRFVFDEAALGQLGNICEIAATEPLTEFESAQARGVLRDIDILVTGWGCPFISREVIAAAPRLKLIAHAAGTVKYHLDPAVYEAGIAVTNAAAANAVPVAEFTLAMILLAGKRVFDFRDIYRADPSRDSSYAMMDEPIGNFGRTVGIIGASHIGRRVIHLLQPFDYEVLLYDPFVRPGDEIEAAARLVDLDTLLATSDMVSLHAPSLPTTRGMIGASQLGLMRDGATLINTARGALVDEAALIDELTTGRLSAVIDVTDPEIPPPDSALFRLPNVFLTPHIAGAVGIERRRLGNLVVAEIERYLDGTALHYGVVASTLQFQA